MTLVEGARGEPPSSGAPDTTIFERIFESVHLEKQQISLADNTNLVPEQHDHGSGGKTVTPVERFSWYIRYSKIH